MNIALLTTEYAHEKTSRAGGIGTFFKILAKGLKEKGHNVCVIVFTGEKNFSFKDNDVCVYVRKDYFKKYIISDLIRSISKKNNFFYSIYKDTYLKERKYIAKEFYKIITNKNIEIIETQDYGGLSYFLKENVPIVIRCHGTNEVLTKEFNYQKPSLYNSVFKELEEKTILKKENYIIVVSKYAKRLIKKYFNRDNVKVIYNGINIDKFKPAIKNQTIPKTIYYFGTLSEKKGLKFLCEVFNELYRKDKEITLHLIGKGNKYFNYLKKNILTKKALKNVFYYGEIKHDDLNRELIKAKTIVFPTQGENFPFVFLEAMSLGKIIISNAIEPAYEIINQSKNGFIAKGKDEFINRIEEVLKLSFESKSIENEARKTVTEKFTSSIMVDNTIEFYKKILSVK